MRRKIFQITSLTALTFALCANVPLKANQARTICKDDICLPAYQSMITACKEKFFQNMQFPHGYTNCTSVATLSHSKCTKECANKFKAN